MANDPSTPTAAAGNVGKSKLSMAKSIVRHLEDKRKSEEDADLKLISENLLPHRGYWPAEGDNKSSILERGKKTINPAATLSLERAAGGLTTGMTPEGQPWYGLRPEDRSLMEEPGVREHMSMREQIINSILRMGGFYQAVHLCNIELMGFGGMLLFEDTSAKTVARFEAITAGTYAIALDSEGNLDTVTRRIGWSAKQLMRKFGKNKLSKRTQELLDNDPFKKIDVLHVVSPREDYDSDKIDNLNMPYESIMFEDTIDGEDAGATDILSEGGYHEMPYFYAPYAPVGGSDYGMGNGHLLVDHSAQLNETERQKTVTLLKMNNPPIKKPAAMKGRMNIGPGQENKVAAIDAAGVGPLYEVPVQGYQWMLQDIKDMMERIAAVAKADLFVTMPLETRPANVTATEFMEQKREKLQQVAPFISIYEPKVLDKVIERTHNMADRLGLFPPPPPVLEDSGNIEVEYISSIAKSLRQVGAEATRALMADVGMLAEMQLNAQLKPTALMKVDVPQAVDELANGVGAPAKVVLDDDAFEKKMAADEAEEKKLQQAALEKESNESLAKVGGVSTQGTLAGEAMGALNE